MRTKKTNTRSKKNKHAQKPAVPHVTLKGTDNLTPTPHCPVCGRKVDITSDNKNCGHVLFVMAICHGSHDEGHLILPLSTGSRYPLFYYDKTKFRVSYEVMVDKIAKTKSFEELAATLHLDPTRTLLLGFEVLCHPKPRHTDEVLFGFEFPDPDAKDK
jgi:hypothetical protein